MERRVSDLVLEEEGRVDLFTVDELDYRVIIRLFVDKQGMKRRLSDVVNESCIPAIFWDAYKGVRVIPPSVC